MKLFDVYPLFDIEPVSGKGCHIFTADGTDYLDLYGGHAVISIGHSHPDYVRAISNQAANLGFYSNSVHNALQQQLADRLGEISGYPDYNLFLCNSGAEANENAMRIASFATGRCRVLAMEKGFHGRTAGAVAATDIPAVRSEYNMAEKVTFVPLNDAEAALRELNSGDYAAVIVEGIQGVGGIHEPQKEFLEKVSEAAKKNGTLLILDEVQSGYGRTGKFFAHQHSGIRPDLITCGKGIANGFPCAAVLINPTIEARHGMLGTTFGGSHLACAAALAVINVIEKDNLVENAATVGRFLAEELSKIPAVSNVRGRGLMIGFEVAGFTGKELRRKLIFDHHIFTGGTGEYTVRLLPPLSLSIEEATHFILELKKAIG